MLFQSLDRGNRMSAEELAILETLPAQLANAIEKARVLATSLSPIQAASGSLELAVRGLVERENKSGRMVIQCTSSIGAHDLPSVVAEECYCIVLEAIECAVRHPSSSRVIVSLTVISDALQIGLKWDADPRTASATNPLDPLRIIGHRVRQLRGALHLAPSSGGGLHCVATIPLKADRCVAGAEADGTSSPARLT